LSYEEEPPVYGGSSYISLRWLINRCSNFKTSKWSRIICLAI